MCDSRYWPRFVYTGNNEQYRTEMTNRSLTEITGGSHSHIQSFDEVVIRKKEGHVFSDALNTFLFMVILCLT